MSISDIIQLVGLCLTGLSMAGAAVWSVATFKAESKQVRKSLDNLTEAVGDLAGEIDTLKNEHAQTRERLARLEGNSK